MFFSVTFFFLIIDVVVIKNTHISSLEKCIMIDLLKSRCGGDELGNRIKEMKGTAFLFARILSLL